MKDSRERIIYVGKAGNLRKRLASYFRALENMPPKTRVMMARVNRIDTISTLSEKEALLLESSLIKKHRPRYNIVLRDDKQYILFKLDKSQAYPALELVRDARRDGAVYFGPFTSGLSARQTLKVINRLFMLRKCGHKKFRNRVRPCLQYHIRRCLAPCCLDVDHQEYMEQVHRVEMFLSGKSSTLLQKIKQDMLQASEELKFEKAAELRDQIRAVEQTVASQSVFLPSGQDLDVFDLVQTQNGLATGIIFVRQGRVLDNKNFFWPDYDISESEETEKALVSILSQFYGPGKFIPERIILPVKIMDQSLIRILSDYREGRVRLLKARGEPMKALLRMARQNCLLFAARMANKADVNLGPALKLEDEPWRIECLDVSHLSGTDSRVGAVVFEDREPVKSDYRIYNMPDITPGDDYQAIGSFISRRASSALPWPDLMLIDGGLGQLNSALRALSESGISQKFALAAISKGPTTSRGQLADQVFIPGRKNPLPLKPGSPELLFLQRIRDEAHRFVIHSLRRTKRRKMKKSDLESIPGIGPVRARALWDHFMDLSLILEAGPEELKAVPGFGPQTAQKTAEAIKSWNT